MSFLWCPNKRDERVFHNLQSISGRGSDYFVSPVGYFVRNIYLPMPACDCKSTISCGGGQKILIQNACLTHVVRKLLNLTFLYKT